MSADVYRLPAQHPKAPHCAACGRQLPTFDGSHLVAQVSDLGDTELVSMALLFRVRCACGARWDLLKEGR